MRRPIRSNVIQRRMFNGGMGMTKPGAPVASGILASSQPLVDVLASQARDNLTNGINVGSQMYGSNVQGTNLMNQGGVANYAPGGISYTTNEAGDVVRIPISGSQEEAEIVENEGLGMFAGLSPSAFGLSDAPGTRFSRKVDQKGAVELFDRRVEQGTQDPTKPMVLPDGTIVVRNANGETEIAVMGRQSEEDIYEVKSPVTMDIGAREYPELKIKRGSVLAGEPLIFDDDTVQLDSEKIEEEKSPVEEVTQQITELQSANELPGYSNPDMPSSGGKKEDVIDYGSLIPSVTDDKNKDKKSSSEANKIDDVEVIGESDAEGDTDQVTDDISLTGDSESILTDKILETSNDKKTTEEKMAAFKEEFKNAMPKYQGMSNEEKGNAWIKMGMAIAAGQSSSTITNIANGVLSTIDEFADDPKQKREFEMKVALAGSKYALGRLNEERVKAESLDKEGRVLLDYVASKPFTFNGKEYAKGDPFQITRAQFDEGALGDLPAGAVVQPAIFSDMEDTLQAIQDFEATKLGSGAKLESWIKERDLYTTTLDDMKSGINMRMYLGEATDLINNGDIMGASGYLRQGFDRALNAVGLTAGQLQKFRTSNRDMYNAKMKQIGTQMLTKILNEGTKTISDNDRKRVEDLIATMTDFSAGTVNIDVVNEKIIALDNQIEKGLQKDALQLKTIEATWAEGTRVKGSPVNPTNLLKFSRETMFPETTAQITSQGNKIFKFEDIWDVEKGVFKRGIDWGRS